MVGFDLAQPGLMEEVLTDYQAMFPEGPDVQTVYGYQAFQAAMDAVKRSCTATDREAFRDALATTNIDALGGKVIFDSPRDNPLGENRSGVIVVTKAKGEDATEFELVPQAGETMMAKEGEQREAHFWEVNALTGQSASYGVRSVHGIELAAKHVNDAGGFQDDCGNTYTVKLTVHDMANNREQAISGLTARPDGRGVDRLPGHVPRGPRRPDRLRIPGLPGGYGRRQEVLRKAADDPTVIVSLGSTPSTGFVPMVPVAGQVKLPIIGTGTAAPISEWNPYAFRVTVTTKAAVPQFMATMVERFDSFKKVALIYDITQDANRAEAELIRDLAGEIGYEIVAFEAFRGGDKDFRAQLTAIRGTDPGWVGIYGAAPEGTAIINQMSEMGFLEEVEFFTGFGSFNGANWWDLTDGKVKGGVNWAVGFDLGSEDSLMKQVVADYGTNFEEDIDIYSVYGYQAFQAAVDAVKRACTATDREAFRDALATTNIQALGGNVILDSPRDNPLGENRSGAIIVNRTTGREATEFEVIPLAK
jgi:branched-chain amino acid transport system substrate-binding protein